ncbi:MAG: hypothetical protein ACN4GM_04240 [Gammaproteobacteria bacterium]
MNKIISTGSIAICLFSISLLNSVHAGEVNILAAEFRTSGNNQWSVNVTLKHEDSGWDHYADNWRIVDSQGKLLGERVLYHPHVNEQPFTRSLNSVKLEKGISLIYIEAHDKMHGWTPHRLTVDLSKAIDGHLRVVAK